MPNPWYLPENANEALDCIEDLASITSLLKDIFAQPSQTPFQLSKEGEFGMFNLLTFMEAAMQRSLNQIAKRRKAL